MIHTAMTITLDSVPTARGATTGAAGTADFVTIGHQLDHCHIRQRQVVVAATTERYGTFQVVVVEEQRKVKFLRPGKAEGMVPDNWFPFKPQLGKERHRPQRRGNGPRQPISTQIQFSKVLPMLREWSPSADCRSNASEPDRPTGRRWEGPERRPPHNKSTTLQRVTKGDGSH